jgi:hypothetical protein
MKNFEKLYKILMNEADEFADEQELQSAEGDLSGAEGLEGEEPDFDASVLARAKQRLADWEAKMAAQGKKNNLDLETMIQLVQMEDEENAENLVGDEEAPVEGEEGEADETLAPLPSDAPTGDDIADISQGFRTHKRMGAEEDEDLYNRPDQD